VVCILDQHAADERVALEKLENALFNPDLHDDVIIHMTKRSITKKNILKSTKVNPPEQLKLTLNDMATLKQHCQLLKKWKFDFNEADDGNMITLTGVPVVCDRVSSVRDFMEFVKELGHLSGGKDVRPKFVKNILASNACRYAIMFGEELDEERQRQLISNLASCNLSFICAHGRPSIIPLCDLKMSKVGASNTDVTISDGNDGQGGSMSEGFGPRRIIRR
jgi:DNA mismatch repair ATPase MutL